MNLAKARIYSVLGAALLASACSSGEKVAKAEGEIPRFRELMAAEQFQEIYSETADELKKTTPEADLTKLLAAVKRKLGRVTSAEKVGLNVNFNTSGTFVTLQFKTRFEKGTGTETFVYVVSDSRTRLAGYHITSNELITN